MFQCLTSRNLNEKGKIVNIKECVKKRCSTFQKLKLKRKEKKLLFGCKCVRKVLKRDCTPIKFNKYRFNIQHLKNS